MIEKSQNLILGLLLASLYIGAGYFGIYLISLPPGNLTLIGLAAGVGFLSFRWLGKRAFFWVVIASLVINFPYLLNASHFPIAITILSGLVLACTSDT